jgi:mannose-6-phosphate isomerase-like protein (cupin superfamily)
VTIEDKVFTPAEGEEFMVPAEGIHKLRSLGEKGRVLEIDIGYTSEDDTYRVDDVYGRKLEEREENSL